jgi:hypothetical protein
MKHPKTITIGALRNDLAQLLAMSDETELYFGDGTLSFYRVKPRGPVGGPALLQFEFNEVFVITSDPQPD